LLNGGDLFSFFIRDFTFEFFFKCHHQLHRIEGICAQIIDERSFSCDFVFFDPKLLNDNLFDAFFDSAHDKFFLQRYFDADQAAVGILSRLPRVASKIAANSTGISNKIANFDFMPRL